MPLSEHDVTLPDGQQIHYYEDGLASGQPVVLLHGGGLDSALLSWKLAIPALAAAGYHVYAPDWAGYGKSAPPQQTYSISLLVETLYRLFAAWGLERAAVVGISMGGGAALGFTLAHPTFVSKLVLIGAYGLQDRAPFHRLSYFLVRIPGIAALTTATLRMSHAALRASLKNILHRPEAMTDELLNEVAEASRHPHAFRMFNQFQRSEIQWNSVRTCFMPRLHEIKQPVLIAHGDNDAGVPVGDAKEAANRLPNAELHIFENAGHWTQRDDPARFNALLVEFLGR